MSYRINLVVLFFLLSSTLLGCSKRSDANLSEIEKRFMVLVPVTDMNKSLHMAVNSEKQYFELGSDIPLIVENKSSHFISFDENPYMKLLRSTGSEWVQVNNAITYSGTTSVFPQGKPLLDSLSTIVKPTLDKSNLSYDGTLVPLRIVIIGEVMNDDKPTGEKVGAFVDISLKLSEATAQPTQPIIYSTAESIKSNAGKIEGVIMSADEIGKPLANVIVDLKYHPFFNQNNQKKVIATTKTDLQGRYSFDNVDPGGYALQITIILEPGGSCVNSDLEKIIKVKVGVVATVNLSLSCTP